MRRQTRAPRPTYPTVDECYDRLHRAGWSVGEVGGVVRGHGDPTVRFWESAEGVGMLTNLPEKPRNLTVIGEG